MSSEIFHPLETPDKIQKNPDILGVHPLIQTRYLKNIQAGEQAWKNRFSTESTQSMPDGQSYGKYENGRKVVDYNSDFWIRSGNAIIEQFIPKMPIDQQEKIMNILNAEIRQNSTLTKFGQYIRIESLVLAWDKFLSSKNK